MIADFRKLDGRPLTVNLEHLIAVEPHEPPVPDGSVPRSLSKLVFPFYEVIVDASYGDVRSTLHSRFLNRAGR